MIDMETLYVIQGYIIESINNDTPPGQRSVVDALHKRRIKYEDLTSTQKETLRNGYVKALTTMEYHLQLLLKDEEWYGNLL